MCKGEKCLHYEICSKWFSSWFDGKINNETFESTDISCRDFKDKSKYAEIDENYHTHICKADGKPIDSFSIFARIVDETDDTVTIERFQKFGALKLNNITISKQDFNRYYHEIKEVK